MVVVPAGEFTMGSPDGEAGRHCDEGPQRKVTIASVIRARPSSANLRPRIRQVLDVELKRLGNGI